jgi:hypothetical protein
MFKSISGVCDISLSVYYKEMTSGDASHLILGICCRPPINVCLGEVYKVLMSLSTLELLLVPISQPFITAIMFVYYGY